MWIAHQRVRTEWISFSLFNHFHLKVQIKPKCWRNQTGKVFYFREKPVKNLFVEHRYWFICGFVSDIISCCSAQWGESLFHSATPWPRPQDKVHPERDRQWDRQTWTGVTPHIMDYMEQWGCTEIFRTCSDAGDPGLIICDQCHLLVFTCWQRSNPIITWGCWCVSADEELKLMKISSWRLPGDPGRSLVPCWRCLCWLHAAAAAGWFSVCWVEQHHEEECLPPDTHTVQTKWVSEAILWLDKLSYDTAVWHPHISH